MTLMSRAAEIEQNIVTYKVRSNNRIDVRIEHDSSPWEDFNDLRLLRHDVIELMNFAFEQGAFVAGGCARWLRSIGKATPLERGAYIQAGGDIDFFFRTPDGWNAFVKRYGDNSNVRSGPIVTLSDGKLAANVTFPKNNYTHGFCEPPKVQAIRCVTGTPEEVLQSFDFVNSMVAFDRERSWVAGSWADHEARKQLAIAWWGSRATCFRVNKYVKKYGYNAIVDVSNDMFDEFVTSFDRMNDWCKERVRDMWRSTLKNVAMPFDKRFLILASTSNDPTFKDVLASCSDSEGFRTEDAPSYHAIINNLLKRQKEAEQMAAANIFLSPEHRANGFFHEILKSEDPSEPFNADEYCWAR